MTDPVFQKIH